MGVHVEGQVVDLVEGLVADGAFVLLLAAVGQLVVLVIPYGRPKTKKGGGGDEVGLGWGWPASVPGLAQLPAQRRRRLARRARPLRVKKLSNFVCIKQKALTTGWRAESGIAALRPCPARGTGRRSVPPAVLGWPANFCIAQRRTGSFSRLLPRWKKFARTRASSLIFCLSSHFKSYSLCSPQLPPGDPKVRWKTEAGRRAWRSWGQ